MERTGLILIVLNIMKKKLINKKYKKEGGHNVVYIIEMSTLRCYWFDYVVILLDN